MWLCTVLQYSFFRQRQKNMIDDSEFFIVTHTDVERLSSFERL